MIHADGKFGEVEVWEFFSRGFYNVQKNNQP